MLAYRPHHRLFARGLQDVVVLDVIAGGLGLLVVFFVDVLVALVEQIEFELGGEHTGIAAIGQPRDLLLQDAARAVRQVVIVVVLHVAQDQRGIFKPADPAQGGQVRLQNEVAIALGPAGRCVARHGLHVDIVGQQVIAAMRFLVAAVEEIFGLETLADQASLHVHHAGEHGIDASCSDIDSQLFHRV